jgi:hypothetical protein
MDKFDKIDDIAKDSNAKQVQLEAAIRSGKFQPPKPEIGNHLHPSKQDETPNSSSSSSSDYVDEEADEVGELDRAISKIKKKISDKTLQDITKRQSVSVKKKYMNMEDQELESINIRGSRLATAKLLLSKHFDV